MRTMLAVAIAALATGAAMAETYDYDVVVYGGTSGAVTAAVQAARMGKTVALIDPGSYVGTDAGGAPRYVSHLGGLSSGGLGRTDVGDKDAIGGMSYDFYRRVKGWDYGAEGSYDIESHKAEAVYDAMVAEAGVDVYRLQRLDRTGGVAKAGATLQSITTLQGNTFRGKAFIDGTYEGDLMAAAGVSYTVGREARATYGETYNGLAYDHTREHVFGDTHVDPYVVPGDPSSGLIAGIQETAPAGPNGSADDRVQAYCYRLTFNKSDAYQVSWTDLWGASGENAPENYDRSRYELHDRYLKAGKSLGDVLRLNTGIPGPGDKHDINNWGPASTDYIGGNYAYPDADDATREQIVQDHIDYTKGFLYYLAFDAPASVRSQMADWGLAIDEFTDNDNFPHQLYVREARRMLGQYVMTEDNCTLDREADNPIGLGAYPMDSHNTHRYLRHTDDGDPTNDWVETEGNFWLGSLRETYSIDYGAITPQAGEADNLLVVCAVSASHTAFGSMRMEPVFMVLGQSAGTAAVEAIDENTPVQLVDMATLQALMRQYGQVLTTSEPAQGPFVGTMREGFHYGDQSKDLETVSYVAPGWAEPWDANSDDPRYDPGAQLQYGGAGYVNDEPVGASGGAGNAPGARAGHITTRFIAGGLAGDIWLSCLARLDGAVGEEALLWVDGAASDDALGLAEGGVLELFGQQTGAGYADGDVHLLLASLSVGQGDDAISLWIDPDLTGGEGGLGLADLVAGGSDLFGDWLDLLGLSVGGSGGALDALRVSNEEDAFAKVVPEPATLVLAGAGLALAAAGKRGRKWPPTAAHAGERRKTVKRLRSAAWRRGLWEVY